MAKKARHLHRGDDAMKRLKEEQQKEQQRREEARNRGPMRFYVGKNDRGQFQEHELIVLDEDASQAVFTYEHNVPGPNNNWAASRQVICIDEDDNCPVCRAVESKHAPEFEKAYARYNMYVTVLDMTPYKIKNGPRAGTVVESTRKLMVIPTAAQEQFKKMFDLCMKQNETTRGMTIVVTKTKDTDARCGTPQMLDNGMLFDWEDPDFLEDYAEDAVVRDGKTIVEEGENIEPFDYDEILAAESARDLAKMFNLPAPAGSEDEEEEQTGSSRRSRRRARKADEEEEKPARSRRTRSRTKAQERDEEEGDDGHDDDDAADEAEDEPEERPTRRRQRASGRKSRSRKVEDEIPD